MGPRGSHQVSAIRSKRATSCGSMVDDGPVLMANSLPERLRGPHPDLSRKGARGPGPKR
jgi:hypothetical protein